MGIFTNTLDWASDKVQTMTGEKERREHVAEIKETYSEFKEQVCSHVEKVNITINSLNGTIRELNDYRTDKIPEKIELLGDFLARFGSVKSLGNYSEEEMARFIAVPERQFIKIEDYINDIDWSNEDVFVSSFFLTPLGIKMKTRNQNLSMRERLNSLRLEAEQTIFELNNLNFTVDQDIKIAELYIFCVSRIISFIEYVVVPEMEVVEAFFQALKIKNMVISGNSLENIEFNNNINIIRNTQFQKHYNFIRNTFMFYVIACKVYNTPILTNLLKGSSSVNDLNEIDLEKTVLETQINNVNQYLLFDRQEA